MLVEVFALLQTPQVGAESWEIAKGVMLSLSTLGVGYLVRTVRAMEFTVKALQNIVIGEDGKNGLRSDLKLHKARIDNIEARNREIDAVAKYESDQYNGPERRQDVRRWRDQHFPNPLDNVKGDQ